MWKLTLVLIMVPFAMLTLSGCNEEHAPKVGSNRSVADTEAVTKPDSKDDVQYDAKTGVKIDTRFLPSTNAHKAIYKPETESIVVVGEVVDAWCYASQTMGAGHGPVHQACAVACIGGGITPGILDDNGVLWLCVKHKAYSGCKDILFPFVARRVKVTGWAAHKGGCNVLKVGKVELEPAVSGAKSSGKKPVTVESGK